MQYIIIYKYIIWLGLPAKTGISNQNCPRKIAFMEVLVIFRKSNQLTTAWVLYPTMHYVKVPRHSAHEQSLWYMVGSAISLSRNPNVLKFPTWKSDPPALKLFWA